MPETSSYSNGGVNLFLTTRFPSELKRFSRLTDRFLASRNDFESSLKEKPLIFDRGCRGGHGSSSIIGRIFYRVASMIAREKSRCNCPERFIQLNIGGWSEPLAIESGFGRQFVDNSLLSIVK